MRTVGIDGDILVYRCGFAGQQGKADDPESMDPLENVLHSVKNSINTIVRATRADSHILFLTGVNNFREGVATIQGYKENRKGKPKPYWYNEIRKYMIDVQGALVVDDQEADDALGIFLTKAGSDGVCASIDKDLLTVPGEHYNWVKDTTTLVSKEDALLTFYTQLLTGDSTDNIPGLYKMTGKRATKNIKESLAMLCTEQDMWYYVFNMYGMAYDNNGMALGDRDTVVRGWLTEIGRLLYIRRYTGEVWYPPDERITICS